MKISEILKQRKEGFCFEFFPPRTQNSQEAFAATAQVLKHYNPLYVSMTYGAGGKSRSRGEAAIDILLKQGGFEVMPHLTSVGAAKGEIRAMLDSYRFKGIDNIMALRGDPPQDTVNFDFKAQELPYGKDLVSFIKQYGHFSVGVAVYPEGHIETSSLDEDLEYTKQKIDAGADFAVTQMFFDNSYFYALLDRMEKRGIQIPVLPGILPLTDVLKVKQLASVCRTTVPKYIEDKLESLRDEPIAMGKAGIDFTIKQCQDLAQHGFKQLHFFTLNKAATMRMILNAL